MCYGAKRRSPIKRRNMSQMHVYMSFYTCQADGLRPLRSLDVFHVACFWGLCEAATSESTTSASFNKQSLPISSPLSQTNRMIKRHTWGEPRGNLPFSLPLCATLCLFLPVLCVLLAYIFSWFWMEPSPQQYHVMGWSNTLMCQGFPFPTQDLVTLVHFIYCQPCTLSHIFFSSVSLNLRLKAPLPSSAIAGKKNTRLLGSVFIFFFLMGQIHLCPARWMTWAISLGNGCT